MLFLVFYCYCCCAGEGFDYGVSSFISTYDFDYITTSVDKHKRYAYGKQPQALKWNLELLLKILGKVAQISELQKELDRFDMYYQRHYRHLVMLRLGLLWSESECESQREQKEEVQKLLELTHRLLKESSVDFHDFFREISQHVQSGDTMQQAFASGSEMRELFECLCPDTFSHWQLHYLFLSRSLPHTTSPHIQAASILTHDSIDSLVQPIVDQNDWSAFHNFLQNM